MKKLSVYVAGPIGSHADWDALQVRVNAALDTGILLASLGFVPIVPHWTALRRHAFDIITYEDWMAIDFRMIEMCDALFRMPGISPGADREVVHAQSLHTPVFCDIEELALWGSTRTPQLCGWCGGPTIRIDP